MAVERQIFHVMYNVMLMISNKVKIRAQRTRPWSYPRGVVLTLDSGRIDGMVE